MKNKNLPKQWPFLPGWFPYMGMALLGLVLVKRGRKLDDCQVNHEMIHLAQQRELLWLPFFLLYVGEFLFHYTRKGFQWDKAYRSISFEREAYEHENDLDYLERRPSFGWRRYLLMK